MGHHQPLVDQLKGKKRPSTASEEASAIDPDKNRGQCIRSVRVKGLDGRIDVEEEAIFLAKIVSGYCSRQLRVSNKVKRVNLRNGKFSDSGGGARSTWGQRTEEEPDKSKAADQGVGGLGQVMEFQVITWRIFRLTLEASA